ncbi:magnesium/cobalt transporter CorA [Halorarum salinum]|uniref:Magnesium transport protein CorA n=1 Tax=Halorarum salinum TaxID=2743089 RepID=A0A7D5QJ31_9EURY|nr:magnesium/cobalt transporter CorA [Halobaculum salinum]QLG61125.1 magnesium/cobalt transporter CorA [Halobaculum salinum]
MIRSLSYTPEGADAFERPEAAIDAPGTTCVWVASDDPGELGAAAERFGVHPLHVEDVHNDVRPKTEVLEEYTFLLVRAARFRIGETTFLEEIRTRQVGIFFGDDWLLVLTTEAVPPVEEVWNRVAGDERRALAAGPDFLGYLVVDRVVDGYFALLDEVEDDIETVEERVLAEPDPDTLPVINDLRRELLSIRRVVWPSRDAVNALYRGDADHVTPGTEKYYRDVYDHLVQLVELTETYRDLTAGARDIYLNTLSQSTNEVMRRLTVVATVVLPLTFVAGVFGMNFETMPELSWPYAYYATMLGMAAVALVLTAYFRREGWL